MAVCCGEHGKGFRAEYSPAFFGDELFAELRKIKAAFDPQNRLNPGKICPPEGIDAPMMKVDAVKRGFGTGKFRWPCARLARRAGM